MVVFVSQPYSGRTEEEVLTERSEIMGRVAELYPTVQAFTIFDQYHREKKGNSKTYFIGNDIVDMGEADLVVFAKGWEKAKGCRAEHLVAMEWGLNILYV